jgi:hypothetical protein
VAALPKQILAFDRQLQTAANELKKWDAEFLVPMRVSDATQPAG